MKTNKRNLMIGNQIVTACCGVLAFLSVPTAGFSSILQERPGLGRCETAVSNMLWTQKAVTERCWAANRTPPINGCRDVASLKSEVKLVAPKFVIPNVNPQTWHNTVCNFLPGPLGSGYLPVYKSQRPANTVAGFLSALSLPTNYLDVSSWRVAGLQDTNWNDVMRCLTSLQKTVHDSSWGNGVEKTYLRWEDQTGWKVDNTTRAVQGAGPYVCTRTSIFVLDGYCNDWTIIRDANGRYTHVTCYAYQQVENLTAQLSGEISLFVWIGTNPFYHFGDGGYLQGNRARFNNWCLSSKATNATSVVSSAMLGYQDSPPGSFPPIPTPSCRGDLCLGNNAYDLYSSLGCNTSEPLLVDCMPIPCVCESQRDAWRQWYNALNSDYFNSDVRPYAVVSWDFTYK